MPRADPHSYADTSQPQARSIDLSLRVDFEERVLEGEAALHFREPGAGPLDLDTRDLRIESVVGLDGAPLAYALAAAEPVLGSRLRIQLPAGSRGVRIRYRTSPQATALQWLEPAQTAGGKPFLFSQCQPIHARSVVPLQDTPRVRITVGSARFETPAAYASASTQGELRCSGQRVARECALRLHRGRADRKWRPIFQHRTAHENTNSGYRRSQ